MAEASIIPAEKEHIPYVAQNVREGDREEFRLLAMSVKTALEMSLAGSVKAWTGLVDGKIVCMFGLHRGEFILGNMRPWMVGTSELDRNALTFLRRCRPVIEEMLSICPNLSNYVWEGNKRSIRWLKWLGFTVGPARSMGKGRFRPFEMTR